VLLVLRITAPFFVPRRTLERFRAHWSTPGT